MKQDVMSKWLNRIKWLRRPQRDGRPEVAAPWERVDHSKRADKSGRAEVSVLEEWLKRLGLSGRFKLPNRKKVNNGDFVRRKHYRLLLVDLSSLKTVFEVRGRRFGLWAFGIMVFLVVGAIWIAALLYTPLRNVLPVKMQADLRDEYVNLSTRLDSAAAAASINDQYANNLLAILSDTVLSEAPVFVAVDSMMAQRIPVDSLKEASENERNFVKRYEDSERFNLSVLAPIAAEGMIFYPPVTGTESESRISESGIPSVEIKTARTTPVSAIYRGTVLTTYFTAGKGITIVIQHPNEFVSVYSGIADSFVARGEKVNAGMRIGMAMEDRYPLFFELWHNGAPLPPTDYISL